MGWILDLGCGRGGFLKQVQLSKEDIVCGIDVSREDLKAAQAVHPRHKFCCARGENLPLRPGSIDRVICNVALPYMNIPMVLAELRRVIRPGGTVYISLHSVRFTLREFKIAFPGLIPTLFRLYVLLNGLLYHVTGMLFPFFNGRIESWQSESAIKKSLTSAGFINIIATHPKGMLVINACLPKDSTC